MYMTYGQVNVEAHWAAYGLLVAAGAEAFVFSYAEELEVSSLRIAFSKESD